MIGTGEDRQARFRALYETEFSTIHAYARRRLGSDAADVVAETFLIAWRRLDTVPQDHEARLWLFGVARHVVANHRRGDRRRARLVDRMMVAVAAVDGSCESVVVENQDVVDVLASLSVDDAEMLRLRYWEGLEPAEIAIVFDMGASTVRSRLTRARQHFCAAYETRPAVQRSNRSGHDIGGEQPLVPESKGTM